MWECPAGRSSSAQYTLPFRGGQRNLAACCLVAAGGGRRPCAKPTGPTPTPPLKGRGFIAVPPSPLRVIRRYRRARFSTPTQGFSPQRLALIPPDHNPPHPPHLPHQSPTTA